MNDTHKVYCTISGLCDELPTERVFPVELKYLALLVLEDVLKIPCPLPRKYPGAT